MMSSFNPVRECWIDFAYFEADETTSSVVPLANFAGPITIVPLVGPGLSGSRTIKAQTTVEDPASVGSPLGSGWSTVQTGGFGSVAADMSMVFTTTGEPYATDDQEARREVLQCPGDFLRFTINTYDAAVLAVVVMGKARKLDQV